MVAERRRPRVRPLHRVEHPANAVEHPADDQQDHCRCTRALGDGPDEPHRNPAQEQVERNAHPARRRGPEHLENDPGHSTAPDDPEQQPPVAFGQRQQSERGVTAGDEDEDHRMVESFHPFVGGLGLPVHPVVGAADREHAHDRHRVDQRGDAGAGGIPDPRHQHQGQSGDRGDERRVHVDPAAGARLADQLRDAVDDGLGQVFGCSACGACGHPNLRCGACPRCLRGPQ